MWNRIQRTLTAPMRIVTLLAEIVRLLKEQNGLLREIHLKTTGSHPLTPKVDRTSPSRKRTGTDVWVRPHLTDDEEEARAVAARERAASPPDDLLNSGRSDALAPEDQRPTTIATEQFDGRGNEVA